MTRTARAARGDQYRRTAFTGATIAFLVFLYLFSPFTQTFLGWFVDFEDNISHRVHEVTFGALFAMIFFGVLVEVRDPLSSGSGLLQAIIGAAALSVVITASTGWEWTTLLYLLPLAAIAALHPDRSRVFGVRFRPRRSLVVLMLLVTLPLVFEGLAEFDKAVNEVRGHQSHWGGMAAYALVILVYGWLAALRVDGWRLLAMTASLGTGLFGLLSLAFAFDASAAPAIPAVLIVIWSGLFLFVSRRTPDPEPREDQVARRSGPRRLLRPVGVTILIVFLLQAGLVANGIARSFSPPNVPHSISRTYMSYCGSCHFTGDQGAPRIDLDYHPGAVCAECHGLPDLSEETVGGVDVGAAPDAGRLHAPGTARPALLTTVLAHLPSGGEP